MKKKAISFVAIVILSLSFGIFSVCLGQKPEAVDFILKSDKILETESQDVVDCWSNITFRLFSQVLKCIECEYANNRIGVGVPGGKCPR